MNDFSPAEHAFDPQVLDRLIDGELAEGERREVLLTLEHEPDGWRQCALAFLEAQTWGQSLTHYMRNPSEVAPAGSAKSSTAAALAIPSDDLRGDGNVPAGDDATRDDAVHHRRWRSWLAVAGSFLVTFSLGMYAQRYWPSLPNAGEAQALKAPSRDGVSSGNGMQFVQMLVTTPDGRQEQLNVPVVDNRFAQFFAQPQMPAVPDNLRQVLTRMGGQLQYRREFVPVAVGGGQALVPFDRLEIVPVRGTVVQ